ncbi:hypothetical protein JSO54_05795 [Riemerella anatipestifer]|uniref:type IV toxin-antitoxin system AbiEi family antitoxin domain-containing protein n=1 Tax=Riemerella anatipestifer TaxID=34085 RepID=UPI001374E8B8|nr:hypothetical protein [Riemerella anatipestifer]
MKVEESIQKFIAQPLTHQLLVSILKDYKRPNDKINELVKSGQLIHLKKGLYVWNSPNLPELFSIANVIYAPSYVSLESALSFRGFIPERVFSVVSINFKSSKIFDNQLGRFEYKKIPVVYYPLGIKREKLRKNQFALIATAEKALMDKVVTTSGILLRSVESAKVFMTENLRIDEEQLKLLDTELMKNWADVAPKKASIKNLIKAIETL